MDDHVLARAPRSPASPGRNVLTLQVLCWGAAAYLEDQDMLLGSPKIEGLGLPSRLPMLRLGCRRCGTASGTCEHRELKQILHNKEAELARYLGRQFTHAVSNLLSQSPSCRWWFAGITRDVYAYARPGERLRDISVRAGADGKLEIDAVTGCLLERFGVFVFVHGRNGLPKIQTLMFGKI